MNISIVQQYRLPFIKGVFVLVMKEMKDGFGETEVVKVNQALLFYNLENGSYLQDSRLKWLRHTNVVKRVIYMWRM